MPTSNPAYNRVPADIAISTDHAANYRPRLGSISGSVIGSDRNLLATDSQLDSWDEFSPHYRNTYSNHGSFLQRCQLYANSLLLHPTYVLFIATIFVLQLTLLVWELLHHEFFTASTKVHPVVFIVLDSIVAALLCIELGIRVIANYETYFHSIYNVIDLLLMGIVIVALCLYTINPDDVLLATLLQVFRSAVQFVRVVLILKHHRERRKYVLAVDSHIDFQQFDITVMDPATIQHMAAGTNHDRQKEGLHETEMASLPPADLGYATALPAMHIDAHSFSHGLPPAASADDDDINDHSFNAASRLHFADLNNVHHRAGSRRQSVDSSSSSGDTPLQLVSMNISDQRAESTHHSNFGSFVSPVR